MNCNMQVLLQILYLEFQNSPSDYPNLIGIKTIQNGKIVPINKNFWRLSSLEHLKNIIKCEKYIKLFCWKHTSKIFFHHSNPSDLVMISLVYLNF